MEEARTVFDVTRAVLFWVSPVIFLTGVLLVLYSNYRKLEDKLGMEVGGIRKRVFPFLETNNYIFHEWLFERKTLTGLLLIVFSMTVFFTFR